MVVGEDSTLAADWVMLKQDRPENGMSTSGCRPLALCGFIDPAHEISWINGMRMEYC